jgi:hypothetical protein
VSTAGHSPQPGQAHSVHSKALGSFDPHDSRLPRLDRVVGYGPQSTRTYVSLPAIQNTTICSAGQSSVVLCIHGFKGTYCIYLQDGNSSVDLDRCQSRKLNRLWAMARSRHGLMYLCRRYKILQYVVQGSPV